MMSSPDSHPTQIVGELKVCPRLPCDILKLLLCNTWVFVVQHADCYFQVVVDIVDISTTHVSISLKECKCILQCCADGHLPSSFAYAWTMSFHISSNASIVG